MPNLRILATLVFLVAAILPARSEGADQPAAPFRVIVNPSVAITSIDHTLLLEAFLRRATHWSDGQSINPVDLPPSSPTRSRFSTEALRRTVDSVKSYWLQAIFSGHGVPPPELDTDEEVVAFVAHTAGAIGYVSGTAKTAGTRIIGVE